MRHVFVMDPLENVKAYKDTTYFLMLAARMRGHTVYYLPPGAIYLDHDRVKGEVTLVDVHETEDHPFTLIETLTAELGAKHALTRLFAKPAEARKATKSLSRKDKDNLGTLQDINPIRVRAAHMVVGRLEYSK